MPEHHRVVIIMKYKHFVGKILLKSELSFTPPALILLAYVIPLRVIFSNITSDI